ncbi:hypothetical protein EVAR_103508_1 [Eumeta japonica]|uniref:Uncharacterized protein n=1 Tax=Eumeta variegata TaxID=151549 RepID=A0A4C1YVS5_EUMVA|nr:hypothetical protein EVAR_103508_1 [Eumeta japonica]
MCALFRPVSPEKKRENAAFAFTKTIEGKTIRPRPGGARMRGRWARERGQSILRYTKGESIFEGRGGAAPQRPRSRLTSARSRVNRDDRAAKLRNIQKSSKTSRTLAARKEILFYYIHSTLFLYFVCTDSLINSYISGWQFIRLNEHWFLGAVPKFEIKFTNRDIQFPLLYLIYLGDDIFKSAGEPTVLISATCVAALKCVASIPSSKRNRELDYGRPNFLMVLLPLTYIGTIYRRSEEIP